MNAQSHDERTASGGGDLERAPGIPRWVIFLGVALLVLALGFVIMAVSGHGPGDHMS